MNRYQTAAATGFLDYATTKTYSAHKCWKDSTPAEVKFSPLPKGAANKQFWHLKRLERQTRGKVVGSNGKISRRDGAVGRAGLAVYQTMAFDYLNRKTGRLDPSLAAIAEKSGYSLAQVKRALVKLAAAGVVHWVRRCRSYMQDGRYIREQETNAYGLPAPGQWRGYKAPPDPPPPEPAAWGRTPPFDIGEAAAQATKEGRHMEAARHLESDPGNLWAAALARLARARLARGQIS